MGIYEDLAYKINKISQSVVIIEQKLDKLLEKEQPKDRQYKEKAIKSTLNDNIVLPTGNKGRLA